MAHHETNQEFTLDPAPGDFAAHDTVDPFAVRNGIFASSKTVEEARSAFIAAGAQWFDIVYADKHGDHHETQILALDEDEVFNCAPRENSDILTIIKINKSVAAPQ